MAGAFIDDAAGVTTTEGLSDPVISGQLEGHNPIIGYLVDGATYAYKQIFVDQVTNGYDYENCEGVYDSGTNTLTKTVNTSSNNDNPVDWLPGDKAIYIVANTAMLGQWERALGNPGTNGYVLSSTTAGVRSWIAQSGATTGTFGAELILAELQSDARTTIGLYDPTQAVDTGSGDDSIIVMVCPGNSQTGGWKGGTHPTTLVANPDVFVYQAANYNLATGTWQNVNFSAPVINYANMVTLQSRYVGHCGGNIATNWLIAANTIQELTGKKVFCIPAFMGSVPSILFDVTYVTDTDGIYAFSPDYTHDNNMWYWTSQAVSSAMTDLRAGTNGAPAAYPNKDFVDIVYGDIATGDALWATGAAGAVWTIDAANTQYSEAIQNFIKAAEGTLASSLGGWAKQWYTKWFFGDVPAGSGNTGGSPSVQTAFAGFTGNYLLANEARSLVWSVPVPTGLAAATSSDIGTSDDIHWNSLTQAAIGKSVGEAALYQPMQRSRVTTDGLSEFTQNISASGYDLSNVGTLGATTLNATTGNITTVNTSRVAIAAPSTLTAPATALIPVTGTTALSGTADSIPSALHDSTVYNFTANGNSVFGGSLVYRNGTLTTASPATVIPSAFALVDTLVVKASGTISNAFGLGLSVSLTPNITVTGGGTASFGPNYPTYTMAEAAVLQTGVTSAMHVGFHSRNVTHTGTVGLEAQAWLSERTSAAQNVALLIGGTLGSVPSVSADFAMWQVNTTPWRFNGAMTLASGDFSLTSGQLNVNSAGYSSDVANSGTNVAHKFKTPIAFSGTTKIVGLTNNGTDVLYFANDGAIESIGNGTTGTLTLRPDNTLNTERLEVSSYLHSASIKWIPSTGAAFLNLETAGSNAAGTYIKLATTTQKTSGVHTQIVNGVAGIIAQINYLGAPGFWGATPVTTKATAGVGSAGSFVGGGGTAATSTSTWSGGNGTTAYTVNDLVRALKDIGILVL